jgi:hypothetical protein
LDDDVSNVGRVKDRVKDLVPAQIGRRVLNRGDVDAELARSKQVVATSCPCRLSQPGRFRIR